MSFFFFISFSSILFLVGCKSQSINEIGQLPSMSPVGSGLQYSHPPLIALYPKQKNHINRSYSLWRDSQAALFKDARAINVGDILTVNIQIDDKASFNNNTGRSRTNSLAKKIGGNVSFLGLKSPEIKANLGYGADSTSTGKGSISRAEKLNLLIAAVVTRILENGNLIVSGSQEVRVNHEMRILNVTGIVRPQDVDAQNTVSYDKIAEARISYGGRGGSMDIQQPPIGQQAIDLLSPL
ncbi:flagellar L-ring protein FlgH [Liberibacter crescens]|nr:flagellar L-ring protein FlgH [Liberibacter crescens]